MAELSSPEHWTLGDKVSLGYASARGLDTWLQHHSRLVGRDSFSDPAVWWGAFAVVVLVAYVVTPQVTARYEAASTFVIARFVGSAELGVLVFTWFLTKAGRAGVDPAWWRSDIFVSIVAFSIARWFIYLPEEAAHGHRP